MLTFTEAEELLKTARSPKAGKPIANNTRLFRRGPDRFAVQLHNTDIVTIERTFEIDGKKVRLRGDDVYTLNTGGWRTVTTKERINRYVPGTVYSVRGVWRYDWRHHDGGHSACTFEDGMKVTVNGPVAAPRELEEQVVDLAVKRTEKAIKKYIDGYVEHVKKEGLGIPGPGDCWGCALNATEAPTDPLEALAGPMGIDHIMQHLEELYFVPSLLWRAVCVQGYRDPSFIWHYMQKDPSRVYSELRSYFTKLKPFLVDAFRAGARTELKAQESRDIRNGKLEVN
jgi:hypothetical protein